MYGDIVVFAVPDDFAWITFPSEPDEQQYYELHYPEYDLKKIIADKSLLEYMRTIQLQYDTEFELCHTRWAEADNILLFNSYVDMYNHVYACRRYTVIHHRLSPKHRIEYLNKKEDSMHNLSLSTQTSNHFQ
jgi:hypothetical protein